MGDVEARLQVDALAEQLEGFRVIRRGEVDPAERPVGDEVVRIELDRLAAGRGGFVKPAPDEVRKAHRGVGLGQVAVVHEGLEAELSAPFAERLLAGKVLVHLAVSAGTGCIRRRVPRIELDGFFEQLDRVLDAALRQAIEIVLARRYRS
jgi:hypothetical protein